MGGFTYKSNVETVKKTLSEKRRIALEAVGVFVEGEAMERAPVKTGNLKGSITHAVENDNAVLVGTPVDYAPHVELGTYKMEEQPFLRPAAESNLSIIVTLFEDVMRSI